MLNRFTRMKLSNVVKSSPLLLGFGLLSFSLHATDSKLSWPERCQLKGEQFQSSPQQFVSSDGLLSEVDFMTNFGPRHTGNKAHQEFINYIECWMSKIGLEGIARDTVQIKRHNTLSRGGPESGPTDHLYGFLPGESEKTIILGVHSDGQNSIEENGVPVLMEIASYLAKQKTRRYTYAVVFPTGHMAKIAGGMEAISWSKLHRPILKDVLIAVAPEHLGAVRKLYPVPYFITARGSLKGKAKSLIRELDIPGMNVYSLGIGSGLAWRVGGRIPTLAGIATPTYLLNPAIGMEVIDQQHLWKQSNFFLEMVKHMETMDPKDF